MVLFYELQEKISEYLSTILRHDGFWMKLDTEHFFARTMYHIDTSIRFHKNITSFFETKTSKGVIISHQFT